MKNPTFARFIWTAIASIALAASPALAGGHDQGNHGDHWSGWNGNGPLDRPDGPCSRVAELALTACGADATDNVLIATANCVNVPDQQERQACRADARDAKDEDLQLCHDQYDARLAACDLLGESRYAPDFAPESFAAVPTGNLYQPLAPGNQWSYAGEGQTTVVQVLDHGGQFFTKDIDGVTCVVVSDVVTDADTYAVVEDTNDWLAQHNDTNDVWYCGEETGEYEIFDGDVPQDPELVDIDGSFKAGRDDAQAGILVKAAPQVGDVYRQEFSLGEAEDIAEVLSTTYVFGGATDDPSSLDFLVPADLANALCTAVHPCLVTHEFTPLEPDANERKYYAQGIGVFLEVDLAAEDTVQLVGCNFDSRCPTPAP